MATGFNLSSAEVGKVLNKRKIVALVQRLICVQVATYPGLIPYNTEEEGEVGRQPPSPRLIGVEHRPTRLVGKLKMASFLYQLISSLLSAAQLRATVSRVPPWIQSLPAKNLSGIFMSLGRTVIYFILVI